MLRTSKRSVSFLIWGLVAAFIVSAKAQTVDLSNVDPQNRSWIESTCDVARTMGPSYYYPCIERNVTALQSQGARIDLSKIDPQNRSWIESTCDVARTMGPSYYYPCIEQNVTALQSQGARVDYSSQTAPRISTPRRMQHSAEPNVPRKETSPDPAVRQVQRYLKSLGYDTGPVDGRSGPQTRSAIAAFQRDRGLQPNGKISRSLLNALQIAVGENERKHETPRPWVAEPEIVATPRSVWPKWRSVDSDLLPARPGSRLSPAEVYEAVKKSVWVIVAGRTTMDLNRLRELSQGSAIVISPSSLLTNCHVVKDRPIILIVQEKEVKEARVTAADPSTDRCILAVDEASLVPVKGVRLFSGMKIGERVYTVGAPSGLELTLGEGIISGLRPSKTGRFVQTTAPISPGSSGGGLFDNSGNLIGVTTFLLKEAQALNFAIAAEDYWR